jgi:O-antigen/teichoic acid export membrane protein
MRHLRRLGGFALLPALSVLASVVLLPLISARFGAAGWVALALGQSLGAIVSVVVGMAWPVIGGNAVAGVSDEAGRQEIFRSSLYSRLVVLVGLSAGAVPLTIALSRHHPWATVLFMLGVSLNGLSAGWYYAGVGRPRPLVLNEGLPRLGGYLVALAGIMAGAPLVWYAACMVVAGTVMVVLNWVTVMGRRRFWAPGGRRLAVQLIREQLRGTVSRVLRAAYTYGGPPLVAGIAPPQLPLFSALDQVAKAGNNALAFLPNAFVHWVGSAGPAQRRSRIGRSLLFLATVSGLTIPGWMLLGPAIVGWLYAGQLELSWWGHLLLVLAISSLLFSTSVELLLLIPLGHAREIYDGSSAAALLGIALVALGALRFGALGGVGAWVVIQVVLLAFYLVVLLRRPTAAAQVASGHARREG